MNFRSLFVATGVSVLAMTAAGAAHAASANAADTPAPQSAEATVGEIVVTATKREQKLQDIGVTVTALGADTLKQRGIANVEDLAKSVPGLSFAPSPNDTPVYTLRGVGFYESSLAAYPDVATYIDQAPLALPILSSLTAFDLERVEVLKGPQGTLFGNNATGGAINFIAAKPTKTLRAGIDLSYGRFNTVDLSGFISGPITPNLQARIAVKATRGDDWQYNYTRNDKLGKVNKSAARLILDWQPTSDIKISLNANGWIDKSDPESPQAYWLDPTNGFAPDAVLTADTVQNKPLNVAKSALAGDNRTQSPFIGYRTAPLNARATDWDPTHRPFADNKLGQITLRGDINVTDTITLTSITGYTKYTNNTATEGDGTSNVGLDIVGDRGTVESITQELRLANSGKGSPLHWVIGGNFEHTKADEIIDLMYYDASSSHGGSFQGFTGNEYSALQRMTNWAAFGNLEYKVLENLTVKGGIRYTSALRTAAIGNFGIPGYVEPTPATDPGIYPFFNATWPFLNQFRSTCSNGPGNPFQPIPVGASFTLDPATCQAGTYHGRLLEHNTSWSAGLEYKPVQGLLLYANVAKGYKAGSFPEVSAATWNQFVPVTQESLIDYEAGFKWSIPDLHTTFNASGFYYDYRNKQLRAKIVDPIFGFLDALVNVPKSRIVGAEFEINTRPIEGLNISLAGTYLQSKILNFNGVDPHNLAGGFGSYTAKFVDFSNAELPFTPKFQFAGHIDYTLPLTEKTSAIFGIGVSAQTKSITGIYQTTDTIARQEYTLPGRALVDLSLGIKSTNGLRVTVWGKNVFNKLYWTNATFVYDNNVRYAGRPAEYGVTLGYSF